jgi:hypothetical protein
MSQLETEALSILGPMLSGLAVQIYSPEQRTLAFWALKTAAVLQEANRSLGLPIPRNHIVALYRSQTEAAAAHTSQPSEDAGSSRSRFNIVRFSVDRWVPQTSRTPFAFS